MQNGTSLTLREEEMEKFVVKKLNNAQVEDFKTKGNCVLKEAIKTI